MIVKLLTIVAVLSTAGFAAPPSGAVRVYVKDNHKDDQPDSWGSGVLISPTLALTNYHVVEDRRYPRRNTTASVELRFPDGKRQTAHVLQESEVWDVALLQLEKAVIATPVPIGTRPKVKQQVTTHGFGTDYEYKASTGVVTNTRMFPNAHPQFPDFFEIEGVKARQGDSGGMVTDSKGRVVGILFGAAVRTKDGVGLTHGITIDRIEKVFGEKFKPSTESHTSDYDLLRTPDGKDDKQLRNDPLGAFPAPKSKDWTPYNRVFRESWNRRGRIRP